MCDAGRIRHHLKRWLWHAKATVLLVGFQAQGTLGRFLVDGVKAVRIQGEEIKVAARIRRLDEYSGHADGPELARWIAARRPIKRGVFLVHGEEPALAGLAERIAERTVPAAKVFTPLLGRHLRADHRGADADRRRAPPAAGAGGGGQSRLAQRHVEADPRHQRRDRGGRRRPRPRRHYPAIAPRARRAGHRLRRASAYAGPPSACVRVSDEMLYV